jgi:hypothetical protein
VKDPLVQAALRAMNSPFAAPLPRFGDTLIMPTHRFRLLAVAVAGALAATMPVAAHAQTTAPLRDPVEAVGREDSVRSSGVLRTLLSRITRRGQDSAAAASDSIENVGTPVAEPGSPVVVVTRSFKSKKDSLAWEAARGVAEHADEFRVVVDLFARQLFVIQGHDTLRAAVAATALNTTLTFGGRSWRFETPRGVRTVLAKEKDPVWRPPDWHFAEVALEHGLKLRTISHGQVIRLRDGTRLKIEGDEVGIIAPGEREFVPLVLDDHIVFDNTLFVPPLDTKHRQVEGELGHFRLTLGDGFMLHGTPYAGSIGESVTHGCIRLNDDDIQWLYEHVPVGTKVYIY